MQEIDRMVRVLKKEKDEIGTAAETRGPCEICGGPGTIVKSGRSDINLLALDLRTKIEDSSSSEQSTSQARDPPDKAHCLCTRCSAKLSKLRGLKSEVKKAPLVKAEHGNQEDTWKSSGDNTEDLSDYEMRENGLEDDVFQDVDKTHFKRKRLSDDFAWDNSKLSSSKCSSSAPQHTKRNEIISVTSLISPCWVCHLCNDLFNDRYSAEEHVNQMHNVHSSKPGEVFPSDIKNARVNYLPVSEQRDNYDSKRSVWCPICFERSEDRLGLLQHLDKINQHRMCEVCSMPCANERDIQCHRFEHESVVPGTECILCLETFSDNIFYESHKRYCYKIVSLDPPCLAWNETLTCKLCKRCDIRSTNITEHLLRHRGTCRVCFQQFEVHHGLAIHSAREHQTQLYYCNYCPDIFTSRPDLEDHLNLHANGKISLTFCRTMPAKLTTEQEPLDRKARRCCLCNENFFSYRQFYGHLQYCRSQQMQYPPAAATSINGGQNEPNIQPNYATTACKNSKACIKLKVFKCSYCGNSYADQNHLKLHELEVHKGMKQEAGRALLSILASAETESATQRLQYVASSSSECVERHANTNDCFQSAQRPTQQPILQKKIEYCDQCNYSTYSAKGLKIHKACKHIKQEGNLKRIRPQTPNINRSFQQYPGLNNYTNEPEQNYRPVEKCSDFFGLPGNASIDVVQKCPFPNCPENQPTYQQPMMTRLKTAIPQPNWQCQLCSKSFKTSRGLSQHLSWHKRKEQQAAAATKKRLQYCIADAAVGNPNWDVGGMLATVAQQEEIRAHPIWQGGKMLATIDNQEAVRNNQMWGAAGGMLAPSSNQEEVRANTIWNAGETLTPTAKQAKVRTEPSTDAGNSHQIFQPWETPAPWLTPDVKLSQQNKNREQTDETVVVHQNTSPYSTGKLQESSGMTEQSTPVRVLRKRCIPDDCSWKCNKCKKHFKSQKLYLDHKNDHIAADDLLALNSLSRNLQWELNETAFRNNILRMMLVKCPKCHDVFFEKKEFEIHEKGHKTNPRESNHDGGKFNCLYCKMRIKGEKAFLTHVITHGMQAKSFWNIRPSRI